jgi:ATP-dependent Clp protease adaptor protein ClpS
MGGKRKDNTGRPGRGDGTQAILEKEPKVKQPRKYRVILHNDDYTTMEFVVYLLKNVFVLPTSKATHLMLTIHRKGKGVAGVYTRDIAETKTRQVLDLAQEHGMPLMCTTEPDD